MKWCRFQTGDTSAYGIIEDNTVTAVTGSPFGTLYQNLNHLSPDEL